MISDGNVICICINNDVVVGFIGNRCVSGCCGGGGGFISGGGRGWFVIVVVFNNFSSKFDLLVVFVIECVGSKLGIEDVLCFVLDYYSFKRVFGVSWVCVVVVLIKYSDW